MKNTAIFIDIETAVNPEQAVSLEDPPIIWIVALAVDLTEQKILETFDAKILFKEERANPEVLNLIGYDKELWDQEGQYPALIAKWLSTFIRKYAWVDKISLRTGKPYKIAVGGGHNYREFDLPILLKWYKALSNHYKNNFWLPLWYSPCIDTLEMYHTYQIVTGEWDTSASLKNICTSHNIKLDTNHNPLEDITATMDLYFKLKDYLTGKSLML